MTASHSASEKPEFKSRVLAVGGSDPIGGAGIQADIKTITSLGGYAATAITAVLVQDTTAVHHVLPMSAAMVAAQMRAVIEDIGVDVIKSGMLATGSIIAGMADVLAEAKQAGMNIPYVLDPVLATSSGSRLLRESAVTEMTGLLLPRAALITPNIPEAAILTGLEVGGVDDMRRAGAALLDKGAQAVLITGGHMEGGSSAEITDLLLTGEGETLFTDSRIVSKASRGTGCTLASAIATGLAKGEGLIDAIQGARQYVRDAILAAPGLGRGQGPLGHGQVK